MPYKNEFVRKKYHREYYKKHSEFLCKYSREYAPSKNRKTKREVLSHYGKRGKLQCRWKNCSVCDVDMLTIDRMNNDGAKDRKSIAKSGGVNFYNYLKNRGFPPGFQTLCFNHQWKKEMTHRRKKQALKVLSE